MEQILDSVPTFTFIWPCKSCGAESAGSYNYDPATMEVTNCSECKNRIVH